MTLETTGGFGVLVDRDNFEWLPTRDPCSTAVLSTSCTPMPRVVELWPWIPELHKDGICLLTGEPSTVDGHLLGSWSTRNLTRADKWPLPLADDTSVVAIEGEFYVVEW